MSLAQQVIEAPDREAVRALVEGASPQDLTDAVEPLAGEIIRLLRVDAKQAFEAAERAEMVADSAGDERARARTRWVKGHVLWGVSRIPEALEAYRTAERAYRSLGAPGEALRIAIGEVNALAWLGRYREAADLGERTRKALVRAKQPDAVARLDLNLGNVHYWNGRPREALAHYDRALRFARSSKDAAMARTIQNNRGTQLAALGRLTEGERVFREVRAEAEAAGERRNVAVADYSLGHILYQRGEYGAAYDTLDAARREFEDLGEELYLTGPLIDLAELLIEVNEFRRAFQLADEARRVAEKQGLRFELGRAAMLQAVAALSSGSASDARGLLAQALATFQEEGRTSLSAMCEVYLAELDARAGDVPAAERALKRAAAVFKAEGMRLYAAGARLALASLAIDRGRRAAARESLDAAASLLRRIVSPWLRARLSHLRGRLAAAERNDRLAIRHYRDAVARIEGIRGRIGVDEFRVSFSEDKAPVYADLVEALLRSGGRKAIEEAFATVERARSRALVDLLAGRVGRAADAEDPETRRLLERMEALRAEINRLSGFDDPADGRRSGLRRGGDATTLLRAQEARMVETVRRLQRRDASLGALVAGETTSLREAAASLTEDTTLVEYFVGPRTGWAFVVTRDGARVVPLKVGSNEIERRMAHLRFQIEKMAFGDEYVGARRALLEQGLTRHLEFFATEIWEPLGLAPGRLVLVPHGALHSLPFAALPVGGGRHVLDSWTISHLPSASARRYVRASEGWDPAAARLLAVELGDRTIPEVRREVQAVRRLFPRSKVLARRSATRDAFRDAVGEADVIHVATHGMFRGDDPAFSALKLADGWLSLYDVYGLRLDADLVCLSACQTGRHAVTPGDELVGLSRGFFYAGASALLASLWPVPDGSTADLMTAFYRALRAGEPPEEALRTAMQAARDRHPHPYHWAPFVLIGTERPRT